MSRRGVIGGVVALALLVALIIWWQRADDRAPDGTAETSETGETGSGFAVGKRSKTRVAPLPGRRVAGVVLLDGAPVAGAAVRLISKSTAAGIGTTPSVISDDAGRFDFGAQPASDHTVVAEKRGLTAARLAIDLRDPTLKPATDQLRLLLHACDAAIHGSIRDTSGGPIARARVASGSTADAGQGVEADDEGRYELCVAVGGGPVTVSADGYAHTWASITAFGRVRRDFSLVPEAIVVGRVIRADDRTPVAGAMLELSSDESPRGEHPHTLYGSSDDDGRFRIEGAAPGSYLASATSQGLATKEGVSVLAEVGTQEPVTCELLPTLAIAGKVVSKVGGLPVGGVSIWLVDGSERRLQAISQPDGTFTIEHVLPGEYSTRTWRNESEPVHVTVNKTDVRDLILEVQALTSIAGRVTHRGKPVDGARVSVSGARSTTDFEGHFLLQGVEPGQHEVDAESHRLGAFTRGTKVEVAKGEARTGVELSLDLSGSIAGVVVDQAGAPVTNASVSFSLLRGADYGTATTAEDGSFTARSLSGGGDYAYQVTLGGAGLPPAEGRRFPPITVRDGQTQITGVRIAVRYARLSIAGRVLASTGQPIPDALVHVEPKIPRAWSVPPTRTDMAGAFSVRDLPAGNYRLRVSTPRNTERLEDVAAGRADVVVRFAEPGNIEGTLEQFTERPDVNAYRTDGDSRHRGTVSGNTFVFRGLTPGIYQVIASSAAGNVFTKATVSAGVTTKLALRNPGIGGIDGRVVDENGRPVPRMQCEASFSSRTATSDADGRFRITGVSVGKVEIGCYGPGRHASAAIEMVVNQTSRVDLVLKALTPQRPESYAGFDFEEQLGEILIKSVVPGGPAARAGLLVGDVILKIEGREAVRWDLARVVSGGEIGSTVKLTIERADKERVISIVLEAAP